MLSLTMRPPLETSSKRLTDKARTAFADESYSGEQLLFSLQLKVEKERKLLSLIIIHTTDDDEDASVKHRLW